MDKERFLASGLLEQYVLGLTSPEESEEVERYASAFPEIQEEIDALHKAMEQYARQYAVPPPKEVKSKILNKIDGIKQQSRKERKRSGWPFLLLSTIAFLMAMLAGNLYLQKRQLQENLEITAAAYAAFQKECEAEKVRQAEASAIYALLQLPSTKTIHLKGSALAPDAVAVAYWNEHEQQGYVNLLNLPEPPAGKQYQIWADIDHKMESMGRFGFRKWKDPDYCFWCQCHQP